MLLLSPLHNVQVLFVLSLIDFNAIYQELILSIARVKRFVTMHSEYLNFPLNFKFKI